MLRSSGYGYTAAEAIGAAAVSSGEKTDRNALPRFAEPCSGESHQAQSSIARKMAPSIG